MTPPRSWMTARSAVEAIRDELAAGDERMALRMLVQSLDHLRALEDSDVAQWSADPGEIGDRRWGTLMRAVARRTLAELGHPVPAWCADVQPLTEPWVITSLPSRRERVVRATPADLAALNIYVTEADLRTARSWRPALNAGGQ